ncbi:MAG: hypothetical protein JXR60_06790 [Bacteroidales bacterium]|nr:hypothetical protein [Bacteroidales bacterium]
MKYSYFTYIIIIFAFVIVFFQGLTRLINENPLGGSFQTADKPVISVSGILSTDYQSSIEEYLKGHFGFHNTFIRINNQIDYSLYQISNANKVVIGKNDILFEDYYISSFLGKDFVGKEAIKNNISNFARLKQLFKKKGIDLFLVIAPGKASYFPNQFPSQFDSETKSEVTNYTQTVSELKNENILYLDLKQFFLTSKDNSIAPLFPKQGVHWSSYGSILAADTILKFVEKETNQPINTISIKEGFWSNDYTGTDYDIGESLNLLWKNNNEQLYYPNVSFKTLNTKKKAIIIGDSFVNSFFKTYPVFQNAFDSTSTFWYYNQQILYPTEQSLETLNKVDEILKSQIILIIFNEQNIGNFDYGFTKDALRLLSNENEMIKYLVQFQVKKIHKEQTWLESIKKKATEQNINLDEAITKDAKWVVKEYLKPIYKDSLNYNKDLIKYLNNQAQQKNTNIDTEIDEYLNNLLIEKLNSVDTQISNEEQIAEIINQIKADPSWLNSITEKAKKNNKSTEQQIKEDALWIINQRK